MKQALYALAHQILKWHMRLEGVVIHVTFPTRSAMYEAECMWYRDLRPEDMTSAGPPKTPLDQEGVSLCGLTLKFDHSEHRRTR